MGQIIHQVQIESLKFEGITYQHEGQDATLNHVDFEFPTNQVLWLNSIEGAGKSTVLQILAGLLVPKSGRYLINDVNVTDMSFEEFLPYRLAIGFSFDYGGLISNRTLYDNLMLPLMYHKLLSPEQSKEQVLALFERFDFMKFKDQRPADVPGRLRKLACLLRAFVLQPQVVLLDDPSVGLGQETMYEFADFLNEKIKFGNLKHVFVSSYDEKFMNLFEGLTLHIQEGQIYKNTEPQEKKAAHV